MQVVSLVSGFIIPRLILSRFGSDYNGITASITQFLSVIALLRAGIGGATRACLYKSLERKDYHQVSATVKATEQFMRKVALIFAVFIVVFACVYPFFVREKFGWLFSTTLVLVISISTFVQYFFGITYQMLLQADQKQYIYSFLDTIAIIINVLLSVVLIHTGAGIHLVKLGSALAFCITPLCLNIYAKKHYSLERNVAPDFSSIGQRWDAFFHQIAAFIHNNTDITLLTIFTNTKEISVYTVYYLVANGLRKVITTVSTGVEAAFGNIIARNEIRVLQDDVMYYETLIHIISSVIFGVGMVLVTPFVRVYTSGVTDVNYIRYTFGYLVIFSEMLFCLRIPYEAVIQAAGHFKQTKKYAFAEAGLNLGVSLLFVVKYGLIGVVIGTHVASFFRDAAYGIYASKHIIHRKSSIFIKRFLITFISIGLIFGTGVFLRLDVKNYFDWVIVAIEATCFAIAIVAVVNYIFYGETMRKLFIKLKNMISTVF